MGPSSPVSRFQERALEKLNHSKKTYERQRSERALQGLGNEEGDYDGPNTHASFEEACELGDWKFVQQFLEGSKDKGRVLFKRNPRCLHVAVGSGRARVTRLLLEYATKQDINRKDVSGTTPLIEVCRSINNPVTLRTTCIKLLLEYKADVFATDKHGDTCLHWLARRKDVYLTRFLFKQCSEALLLTEVRNEKFKTPVDLGRADKRYESYLSQKITECGFLRKMLHHRRIKAIEQRDATALSHDLLAQSIESSHENYDKITKLCTEQHLAAEKERKRAEEEVVNIAVGNATEQIEKWLQGPYGSNEVKALTKTIKKDMKERLKAEGGTVHENISKEAKERAIDMLVKRKQGEAKTRAIHEFRSRNPPI